MSPSTSTTRIVWMDAVRGTAILLLLIWHAGAVPVLYGQEMPEFIRTANAFFTPFRMPTLMLLSGMLLARSLLKPLPAYYAGKFAMILWPYVIWVLIAKATFLDIEGMPWWHWRAWYATSYLWFLFFIGVYYLVAPAFKRLPAWLPVLAAAVIGVLLPHGSMEQRMAYFAVFFFFGNWLGRQPSALTFITQNRWALTLAIPAGLFGIASAIWTDALQYSVWGAPASIAGMIALAAMFSRLRSTSRPQIVMQFLGRSSLVYYVSHFPVMALLSMWLVDVIDPVLLTALNLVAGIGVGTALALAKNRVPARWLFEAPKTWTRGIEKALSRWGGIVTR